MSDTGLAMREMQRVAVPGGSVAGYVWDFAGEMQVVRRFWDAAIAVDRAAEEADQAVRFRLCRPEPLRQLFVESGLRDVEVRTIEVAARFPDFDTYWTGLTTGDGSTVSYANSISDESRKAIRKRLYQSLPLQDDGSFDLVARAWAVCGVTVE
ncbi:MAG: hypothetical protein ACT4SY_11815 [Hyphomicrobiales bacterium]